MGAASDKLGKVKAAMKLLAILKARAELNGDVRVLDASGKGLPAPSRRPPCALRPRR